MSGSFGGTPVEHDQDGAGDGAIESNTCGTPTQVKSDVPSPTEETGPDTHLGQAEDDLDTDPYGNSADDEGGLCQGRGLGENETENLGELDDDEDEQDYDDDYDEENDNDDEDSEEQYKALYIQTRGYLINVLKKKLKIPKAIGVETQTLYKNESLSVPVLEMLRQEYSVMLGDSLLTTEDDQSVNPLKSTVGKVASQLRADNPITVGKGGVTTAPSKKFFPAEKMKIATKEKNQVSFTISIKNPLVPYHG